MRRRRICLIVACVLGSQIFLHKRYQLSLSELPTGAILVRPQPFDPVTTAPTKNVGLRATYLGQAAQDSKVPNLSSSNVFGPGNEDTGCVAVNDKVEGVVAAVVVVAFDRASYLERTMNALLDVHNQDSNNAIKFPLFVSQDGNNSEVLETVKSYTPPVKHLMHVELHVPVKANSKENIAYYRIANHYKFMFIQFFDCFIYPRLIVLEDDMEVAVDFFSYFEATAALLEVDPTLYTISSWNDHGQERFVRDPYRLYRSDFFPGLGWLMGKSLWDEIKLFWPKSYWDDWMRLNSTRKGRQSIFPEVCRNYNFGEHGSSKGQFFRQFLKPIKVNIVPVPWAAVDLTYLQADRYEADFNATFQAAKLATSVGGVKSVSGDVKLLYDSEKQYKQFARSLRMMPDWKDGVPRAAYHGTVIIHYENARVFIGPSPNFNYTKDLEEARLAEAAKKEKLRKLRPTKQE